MIPESNRLRDIVYPVRRGDWNLELRYSLRSLVNLPHARVILVGYVPSWANPDIGLIRDQGKEAPWHASAMHLLHAMDQIRDLSDPFYLFNDDFYVMQPMDQIPILNRGPYRELIQWYGKAMHRGIYFRGMEKTLELLDGMGYQDPLAFNLHAPMPIAHCQYRDAYSKAKGIIAPDTRTVYGNLLGEVGVHTEDFKVYPRTKDFTSWPFLSSNDDVSHTQIGKLLASTFPGQSAYESD